MNIKECRKKAGLTQMELAKRLGISQNAVAMWESGRSSPRALDVPKIADALGCTINDLYGRGEEE